MIVYLPSRCGCFAYVMKNCASAGSQAEQRTCDLFVSGPAFAIATMPRALNWSIISVRIYEPASDSRQSRRRRASREDVVAAKQMSSFTVRRRKPYGGSPHGAGSKPHHQRAADLILERSSPYRLSTLARPGRVARLDLRGSAKNALTVDVP